MNNKPEIDLHIDKFDSDLKKLFSKRTEFIKWEKYFLYVMSKELEDIKSEVYGNETTIRRRSLRKSANIYKSVPSNDIEMDLEPQKLIYSYELTHMLRCHSVNGNPQDETTVIYDAAFEPCKINKGKYTNLCATCGGSMINFIDVSTGKVLKRFNESKLYHSTKEV